MLRFLMKRAFCDLKDSRKLVFESVKAANVQTTASLLILAVTPVLFVYNPKTRKLRDIWRVYDFKDIWDYYHFQRKQDYFKAALTFVFYCLVVATLYRPSLRKAYLIKSPLATHSDQIASQSPLKNYRMEFEMTRLYRNFTASAPLEKIAGGFPWKTIDAFRNSNPYELDKKVDWHKRMLRGLTEIKTEKGTTMLSMIEDKLKGKEFEQVIRIIDQSQKEVAIDKM